MDWETPAARSAFCFVRAQDCRSSSTCLRLRASACGPTAGSFGWNGTNGLVAADASGRKRSCHTLPIVLPAAAILFGMIESRARTPDTSVVSGTGEDTDQRLYVASVEKAMRVLSAFGPERRWMSLAEIAEASGIGRSAAQRFVYTLFRLGYLQRDPVTRQYSLAVRLLSLVRGMLAGHTMLERGQPVLAELARATGETVSWVELDGDEIVVVANIPSVHVTRVHLPVGSRFVALPSSSGQVLLWQAERSQLAAMFRRLRPAERERLPVPDATGLQAWLQRSHRTGYVLTERHLDALGVSVSAPVYDVQGRVAAAINISTLRNRHDAASTRRELVPRLLEAARGASA